MVSATQTGLSPPSRSITALQLEPSAHAQGKPLRQTPHRSLVGNLVASLTIQQLGATGTATRAQVLARFEETDTE